MPKSKSRINKRKTPPKMATFQQFPQLPADIRQQIWSIAAASSSSSSTPGICIFSETYDESMENNPNPPHLPVHEPHNRVLLETNTEAHDIALMSPGPTREYDPDIDTLYITRDSFHHFTGNVCGYGGPEWVSRIRHLAIPFSLSESGSWLPIAMTRLASLKTLSLAFPAPAAVAGGTVDCFQEVVVPGEGEGEGEMASARLRLRVLTKGELEGITVKANYMYDTWAGAFPVVWEHNGREHLEGLEERLDQECAPEAREEGDVSPVWDAKGKRLGIRYEGCCFEVVPERKKFSCETGI